MLNGSVGLLDIGNLILRARREIGGRYSYRVVAEISLGQRVEWWKPKLKGQAEDGKKPRGSGILEE